MSKDLGDTKSTLEKEHKLVVLQMQAINELWKKVCIAKCKALHLKPKYTKPH